MAQQSVYMYLCSPGQAMSHMASTHCRGPVRLCTQSYIIQHDLDQGPGAMVQTLSFAGEPAVPNKSFMASYE